MTRTRTTRLVAVTAGVLVAFASAATIGGRTAAAAPSVTVTDLGALPGGTYGSARAINALSQTAGVTTDATQAYRQAIWAAGVVTPIATCCGGGLATPKAINDAREVVATENGGYATNGVYWDSAGVATTLPSLPGGLANRTMAFDINNSGVIVGRSRDAANNRHAVMWNRTTFARDLGFLGQADPLFANSSSANGINDNGDVVGDGLVGTTNHAFIWRNGSFTDLGNGSALDINNNGLIVGTTPGMVPAYWKNGLVHNLPGLSGAAVGYGHIVTDLNNVGDIVGYAPALASPYQDTAVLWRGGKAIDLGRYPGGAVSRAYGINDAGQIVGEGSITPGGPMHALMWTVTTPVNTAPKGTLVATGPTSILKGQSISVSAKFVDPDNGPWTYTIKWGNGPTSGTAATPGTINASRTYSAVGQYRVWFVVSDSTGASAQIGPITVTVS